MDLIPKNELRDQVILLWTETFRSLDQSRRVAIKENYAHSYSTDPSSLIAGLFTESELTGYLEKDIAYIKELFYLVGAEAFMREPSPSNKMRFNNFLEKYKVPISTTTNNYTTNDSTIQDNFTGPNIYVKNDGIYSRKTNRIIIKF